MRRRTFLIGAAAAAGGLVVGYRAWAKSFDRQAVDLVANDEGHLLAGWLKIAPDDTVTVYIPHIDMGQGTHTALAMLAAEELDADWSKVRTKRAPGEKPFANRFLARGWILGDREFPVVDGAVDMVFIEAARQINLQITGGSTAVRFTGRFGMRFAGAAARAMLVEAAADRWDVPAQCISVRDGVVSDPVTGQSASFGELAQAAAEFPVPRDPPFKDQATWRLAGTSPLRADIPPKTIGAFEYGIDFQLPGMLHAAVRSAPVHGGRLLSVDATPARAMSGVVDVVATERAVAVIADLSNEQQFVPKDERHSERSIVNRRGRQLLESPTRETPKSNSFQTVPSFTSARKRLRGLTSRWTTPTACTASRPAAISRAIFKSSGTSSRSRRINEPRSVPRSSSMTM